MPSSNTGRNALYDFEAPAIETAVLGFRLRDNRGGKFLLRFLNPITDTGQNPTFGDNVSQARNLTVSLQRAPASSGVPGTFTDSSAALNGEAIVDVVIGPGQSRDYTVILRPEVDKFVLIAASGATRGQMIVVDGDSEWDRWRAPEGSPVDGSGRFDGVGGMTKA